MQMKYCDECGQENMITAKFCLACSLKFPNIEIKGTATAPQSTPKPAPTKSKIVRIEIDEETGETSSDIEDPNAEAEANENEGLASFFMDEVVKKLPAKRDRGVSIKEVLATDETELGRKGLAKRKPSKESPRTAKDVMALGKNRKGAEKIQ